MNIINRKEIKVICKLSVASLGCLSLLAVVADDLNIWETDENGKVSCSCQGEGGCDHAPLRLAVCPGCPCSPCSACAVLTVEDTWKETEPNGGSILKGLAYLCCHSWPQCHLPKQGAWPAQNQWCRSIFCQREAWWTNDTIYSGW